MISLINSIGQRKVSKILFFISLFVATTSFLVTLGVGVLIAPLTWLGVFCMAAPVGFLALSASKTKEYRLLCIFAQIAIIVINLILYILNIPDFLFLLTVIETLLAIGVWIFLLINPVKEIPKKKVSRPKTVKEVVKNEEE